MQHTVGVSLSLCLCKSQQATTRYSSGFAAILGSSQKRTLQTTYAAIYPALGAIKAIQSQSKLYTQSMTQAERSLQYTLTKLSGHRDALQGHVLN